MSTVVPVPRFVGESVPRSEDRRILTGSGRYVDDIHLPGMLHAAFVRSPVAHALVTAVNVDQARALPGVVAVYTGAELQELLAPGAPPPTLFPGMPSPAFTILATDKVRLVGDPVALVVAETKYLAEDAAELVEVDYEDLPPVASSADALDPNSVPVFADAGSNVLVNARSSSHGDLDGAFAAADRVVSAKIDQHRHQNVPMECRGSVSDFDPDTGTLTVHGSNQGVHLTRMALCTQLGLPPDKVRVLCGDIGGSFGLKFGAAREEIACAAASRALERPVKWAEDRREHLMFSGHAREESMVADAAVTNAGDVLGLKVAMTVDTGAYPGMGSMISGLIETMLPGPYKIAAIGFTFTATVTNKATYVAYRGPWAAETFTRERLLDIVAREVGIEPLDLRLRNVVTRGEPPLKMVTGRSLVGVTTRESLERMAEIVDLPSFRRRQASARAEGRHLGIGFATYIEAAPGPRDGGGGGGIMGPEQMRMRLEPDGTVSVFTGQMPHGQGHETTLAQIAADEIGVPFEQVRVVVGDTDVVPMGMTGGSRAATMAGGATLHTARAMRERILDVSADLLEASAGDLELTDGKVAVRGVPVSAISLAEVSARAPEPLEVSGSFDGGEGGWSGGTHCAIVEVDVETGQVRIERYIVVEDCGALINPAIVEGQVRGGVAQGIGAVLLERSAYDENAQFLAGTFMDYLLPTATEIPRIEIHHLETVPLDPDVNFRGVGEGGMIVSPPTLCNAIEDALVPFGVTITEQHLPPTRILELIGAIEPD
ncbi:MAG TPA: xanthine dehydrogenase family protein molybdopterin-binding subunit [Acidimicrobiales bacterium]|nr:xanthine dehydrogenase family protein molybdopterin-binding subunit [Acidimicrobiales bacterium]